MQERNDDKNNFLLLYSLTKTLSLFIFVFSIFMLAFYVIGNYQNFQDDTLTLILKVISFITSFLSVFSAFGIIESIIFIIIYKKSSLKKCIITLILMIFCFIYAVSVYFFSGTITYLSQGI